MSTFLFVLAVLAVLILHVSRSRRQLVILAPFSILFLLSAVCLAFGQDLGLGPQAHQIGLYGYMLWSFLGMVTDFWLRRRSVR
jgi:hypothetical protein